MKFYTLVHCGSPNAECAELWKSISEQIQDGGWPPNFQPSNIHNSAEDCPISLKIGRWVRYRSEKSRKD